MQITIDKDSVVELRAIPNGDLFLTPGRNELYVKTREHACSCAYVISIRDGSRTGKSLAEKVIPVKEVKIITT